jgi:glutaminyl-tRNA synthetase
MNFIEEKIIRKGNLDKLRFRFPPENNGFLHIGHAKSICLNFGLAEKYNAPCILRFDDTNPSTEKSEYVDAIIKDISWLGFVPSKITHTSDYFQLLYDYAIVLIKKGLAYVDDSSSEEIALMKGTPTLPGMESPYRERSINENLGLFRKMKSGEFVEGSKVLRAKIDMSSTNMILRDPILYRIISKEHHRTLDTWKIYPMYDFAHPLSDYIEGITDSLCTMEFEIHRPLYVWILENCNLIKNLPEETEFARLNIDYTVLSKRKLKILVDEGFVSGWDDPRLYTISGLRRRGFTSKSIRNFCEEISVTKNEYVISHKLLEKHVRDDLNKSANRLMGVMDPIKLTITNWDKGTEYVEIENNPEDPNSGKRMVPFSGELYIESEDFNLNPDKKYHRLKLGGEVRLKGAYVIRATDVIFDENNKVIEIKCVYDPLSKSGMTIDRKIKGAIHWVSIEHAIKIPVNEYDVLFTNESPTDDDFVKYLNPNSLVINNNAVFEPEVLNHKTPVQMIRKGYYVLDKDGKSLNKIVSLKESW